MATHSSVLAWRILWTEAPGGLPWDLKGLDMTERLTLSLFSLKQESPQADRRKTRPPGSSWKETNPQSDSSKKCHIHHLRPFIILNRRTTPGHYNDSTKNILCKIFLTGRLREDNENSILWASLMAQWYRIHLGLEDPLEEEMKTCSSMLAWEIPCIEGSRRLQSTGSQKVWT